MRARPRAEAGGIDESRPFGAFSFGEGATARLWHDASHAAFAPIDAFLALAAFNANQTLTAQIDLAHSFARTLQGHAAFTEAGARSLAAGPVRDVVDGTANLQAEYARHVARVAQTFGRHFGHLAFAFPATRPFH